MMLTLRNWFGRDELAVLRFCMKVMCCWPEKRTWWKSIISWCYPLPGLIYAVFVWWFLVFEAKEEGVTVVLQTFTDSLSMVAFSLRGIFIMRHANEIYELSNTISQRFQPIQNSVKGVRIQQPLAYWLPCIIFCIKICISFVVSFLSMLDPPETREPSMRLPKAIVENDIYFNTLMINFVFGAHWCCYFMNTTAEALLIGLSTTMCEKAMTLRKMIYHLNSCTDHLMQDAEMNNILKYHVLLGNIRDKSEEILSGPMLYQLFFLMVSLGSPGIRVTLDELKPGLFAFMGVYVIWISAQLITYCLVCDKATYTCTKIGFASYSAYDPAMSRPVTQKLLLLMMRAQRPMHLTARRLVKLNRQTLLMVYKRSYKFYSTIFNLA